MSLIPEPQGLCPSWRKQLRSWNFLEGQGRHIPKHTKTLCQNKGENGESGENKGWNTGWIKDIKGWNLLKPVETVLKQCWNEKKRRNHCPEPGLLGKAVLPQLLDIPQVIRRTRRDTQSVGISQICLTLRHVETILRRYTFKTKLQIQSLTYSNIHIEMLNSGHCVRDFYFERLSCEERVWSVSRSK